MGGFHLLDSHVDLDFESREELDELGQMLNRYFPSTRFVTGHCTGEIAYKQLKTFWEISLRNFM